MNALLIITVGVLYTIGVYLLLQRTLTRILMGLVILGHGANLLLLFTGGRAGAPPILVEGRAAESVADPMPQALALTAIVISFGITAYLLALAWRSFADGGDDEVEDDVEDRRIAAMAAAGDTPPADEGPVSGLGDTSDRAHRGGRP